MFTKENFHRAMSLEVVRLDNHKFAIEERNGNISFNLTMMAKPYGTGKRPNQWLRTDEAKRYLEEMTKVQKSSLADLLEVRKGGTPELAGTWAYDYRIAVRFAQWLNPKFAILVDELIFQIMTKQVSIAKASPKYGVDAVILDGKPMYQYTEVVKALGGSARSGYESRRRNFPQHFVKAFGRNFITAEYAELLAGYYNYRNAQLRLTFGGQ